MKQEIEVDKIYNFFLTYSWLEPNKLQNFIKLIHQGKELPPIEVVSEDDGKYTVYDGHHRLLATKLCNRKTILCNLD